MTREAPAKRRHARANRRAVSEAGKDV